MKKVLIFPASFQYVKNYLKYDGVDIWLKPFPQDIPVADYYIGHSAGASFILSQQNSIRGGTYILVNPIIRKRTTMAFFWSWIKFFIFEDTKEGYKHKLIPMQDWPYVLQKVLELLNMDTLAIIRRIPKEKIVIIRGKNDYYFCDEKSAEIIKQNGINLIEVDAGHNWNEKIAQAAENCMKN
ncbi:MAG: hypothetical protein HY433_00460 [Candidatus Liptonbacteria bacterium]|nr:hypothetical protein [Candidatus Liptonbacteria bacterium]